MAKFVDIENGSYKAIEGWRGTLVYNKVLVGTILYGFIKPIKQPNVSIYALKHKESGRLVGFALTTDYCYHYTDHVYAFPNNVTLYSVCTGYMDYYEDMTDDEARQKCVELADILRTVNTHSMPYDYGSPDDDVNNILADLADNGYSPSDISNFKEYFKKML